MELSPNDACKFWILPSKSLWWIELWMNRSVIQNNYQHGCHIRQQRICYVAGIPSDSPGIANAPCSSKLLPSSFMSPDDSSTSILFEPLSSSPPHVLPLLSLDVVCCDLPSAAAAGAAADDEVDCFARRSCFFRKHAFWYGGLMGDWVGGW